MARSPGDTGALIARAELYRLHGDLDAALADLGEAVRLAPANDHLDFLRGRALVDAKRPHLAKTYLDRFVARHPDNVPALLERARAHRAMFAREASARDYDLAFARMPRPTPDEYLERMRAQLAAGRTEAALGGLDEGITRLGPLVALQLPAIDLEVAAGRWDQALARLDRLAGQSPRKETHLQRRGEILLKAGRREEARQAFGAALNAVAALPPHLRATPAMVELNASLRRQLRATVKR